MLTGTVTDFEAFVRLCDELRERPEVVSTVQEMESLVTLDMDITEVYRRLARARPERISQLEEALNSQGYRGVLEGW